MESRPYPAGFHTRTMNMNILTTRTIPDCRDGSCARPLDYCPRHIAVHGKPHSDVAIQISCRGGSCGRPCEDTQNDKVMILLLSF